MAHSAISKYLSNKLAYLHTTRIERVIPIAEMGIEKGLKRLSCKKSGDDYLV